MRVLLIDPGSEVEIGTNLPKFVDEQRGALPSLGLLYVATSTREDGHNVRVLDCNIENRLDIVLRDFQPEVVGITSTTFTLLRALKVASLVKKYGATVVMGGIHASIYPNETTRLAEVDYVIIGEGERAFPDLLNRLMGKDLLLGQKDCLIMDYTASRIYLENLDAISFPDRTLTDYRKYTSVLGTKGYITTMITSRGCPFQCVFCHRPTMGKKFRARSAKNVLEELTQIKELGIGEVMIYDDTFAVDRNRVVEICEGMIERRLKLVWDMRTRVDLIDVDLLKLLKRAGCKRIHYGVEAGSDRILREIQKGITIEQAVKAVKLTKQIGIETLVYFILGCPSETCNDIETTIRLACELDAEYCHFAIMTPYPHTPLYDKWIDQGGDDYWYRFALSPSVMKTPYWGELTGMFQRNELESLLNDAYRRFYTRRKYLIKRVSKLRNITDLKKGLKVFQSIIKSTA